MTKLAKNAESYNIPNMVCNGYKMPLMDIILSIGIK